MELTAGHVYTLVITLCGLTYCLAQHKDDLMIVSDFSPPAIYTAPLGKKPLRFTQVKVDRGRRNITAPADVEYDPVEKRIYWTQWSSKWTGEGLIARCDLKGNNYQVLIKELDYAVGIALDTVGRKMYFSHEGMALEVANLDGRNRKTLIRELPTSGLHVFFDGIGKRVYVSDSTKKIIESVKLNGRNRTVHISAEDGLIHPSDVVVDRKARRMYYADFGTDRIVSTNLRGEQAKLLYQYPLVSTDTEPHSLAVTHQNELYWVDRDHPKLMRIPKNPRRGQMVNPRPVGNVNFGWPSGIHIYQVGGSEQLKSASLVLYLVVPLVFQFLLNH